MGQNEGLRWSDEVRWVEVWFNPEAAGDLLLVLRQLVNGSIELVDPHEDRRVIATFDQYEDAEIWFGDEEYTQVRGRWAYDE